MKDYKQDDGGDTVHLKDPLFSIDKLCRSDLDLNSIKLCRLDSIDIIFVEVDIGIIYVDLKRYGRDPVIFQCPNEEKERQNERSERKA